MLNPIEKFKLAILHLNLFENNACRLVYIMFSISI